ncbi:hypothetical protein ACIBEJ_35995 [Nonomuraea sp. NPDC050790]|uniref:hypothetical protein n=1 Tax=Nonomuraea sp. NPDC050790 TaxID=3364371 RepID=UPI003798CED7
MEVITVQRDFQGSTDVETRHLRPGESISFGRGTADTPVDLPLDDPAVSRKAGTLRAVKDYWEISNLSRRYAYVVENLEGGGFVRLSPGTVDAPIPFETARVRVPGRQDQLTFLVLAPLKRRLATEHDSGGATSTAQPYPLDPAAKYFLVLAALCEPQLRDPARDRVPSVPEVRRRLAALGLSRSAVNYHVDFLAGTKFRLQPPGQGAGVDWKPRSIVSHALRFGLITPAHLVLLPPE